MVDCYPAVWPQHVDTCKTGRSPKEARAKRPPPVASECGHFDEMSRVGKPIGTGSRLAVAWGETTNGHEDENGLKLD